jgi:hypothetical protein
MSTTLALVSVAVLPAAGGQIDRYGLVLGEHAEHAELGEAFPLGRAE